MATQAVRPPDLSLMEALPDETKTWILTEFKAGRLSTRTMTTELRSRGHRALKRQDVWAWINQEITDGTEEDS